MKKQIEFPVHIKDFSRANLYLRAVWSEIRKNFGGCSWQYSPFVYRDLKMIRFGLFTTKDESLGTVEAHISYMNKGGIERLIFNSYSNNDISKLENALKDLAKNFESRTRKVLMAFNIATHSPFTSYENDSFRILTLQENYSRLDFYVQGFDKQDCQYVAKKKLNVVMDLLAGNIWHAIEHVSDLSEELEVVSNLESRNIFSESIDFTVQEEVLESGGYIYLPKKTVDILDLISNDKPLSNEIQSLLAACKLYHSALKTELLSTAFTLNDIDLYEVLITKYMSVLEVLSTTSDPLKKCETCGQNIFSISKRVKELLTKVFQDTSFVKKLHSFYNDRSKFLHTGKYLSTRSYLGVSIPQLSNSDELVESQTIYDNGTVKFSVGQCIHYYQENLIANIA